MLEGGTRLPDKFKTFDFYDSSTRTATSLKSIDLALKSYRDASYLGSKLSEYINEAADFTTWTRRRFTLDESMIGTRDLTVAIPDVFVTSGQWNALYNAYQYGLGLENPVSVQYLVVTG